MGMNLVLADLLLWVFRTRVFNEKKLLSGVGNSFLIWYGLLLIAQGVDFVALGADIVDEVAEDGGVGTADAMEEVDGAGV